MKYIKLFEEHLVFMENYLSVENKLENDIRDILVELFDKGMNTQLFWPDTNTIIIIFHYPLGDDGRPSNHFKIDNIYEYCECSYSFRDGIHRVGDLTNFRNEDVIALRMYINKIPTHKQRTLY